MSASVEPVAISLGSSSGSRFVLRLSSLMVISPRSALPRARPIRAPHRPVATCTGMPSASRSEPSTTTMSPGLSPERISTTPVPVRSPMRMGRTLALPSCTTYATKPCSLACTALSGTTVAALRDSEASETSAKKPGLRMPGFLTQASTSTWRVAGSATSPTW